MIPYQCHSNVPFYSIVGVQGNGTTYRYLLMAVVDEEGNSVVGGEYNITTAEESYRTITCRDEVS